ncbi:MAG: hypothetical protein ACLGIR_01320 [Actinomycetes bacterium]
MRRTRAVAALLALPLAVSTMAAHAPEGCYVAIENDPDDPTDDVFACERETYVADTAGTKVGNLYTADAATLPTFVDDAPAQSVRAGAGAGFLGTSLLQLAEDDYNDTGFAVVGEFEGLVDTISLELHGVHSGFGRLPVSPTDPTGREPNPTAPVDRAAMTAYVSIEIDGNAVVAPQTLMVEFTTDQAPTAAASERFRAVLTGVGELYEAWGIDPAATNEVLIRVTPRYVNTDPVVAFLYGTTEVPSSIVFNSLSAPEEGVTVVDVTTPAA